MTRKKKSDSDTTQVVEKLEKNVKARMEHHLTQQQFRDELWLIVAPVVGEYLDALCEGGEDLSGKTGYQAVQAINDSRLTLGKAAVTTLGQIAVLFFVESKRLDADLRNREKDIFVEQTGIGDSTIAKASALSATYPKTAQLVSRGNGAHLGVYNRLSKVFHLYLNRPGSNGNIVSAENLAVVLDGFVVDFHGEHNKYPTQGQLENHIRQYFHLSDATLDAIRNDKNTLAAKGKVNRVLSGTLAAIEVPDSQIGAVREEAAKRASRAGLFVFAAGSRHALVDNAVKGEFQEPTSYAHAEKIVAEWLAAIRENGKRAKSRQEELALLEQQKKELASQPLQAESEA